MTKLIWKLYNTGKISLKAAVELLAEHDRRKELQYKNK